MAAVSEEVRTITQVAAGNQNWSTQILGESADYFDIRQWPLADGAPFTAQDVRCTFELLLIDNSDNRYTIAQAYNVGLRQSASACVVFVHDDVRFRSPHWGPALLRVFERFPALL